MIRWYIGYYVGNTYKHKYLYAKSNNEAIKKSRIKNIIELYIVDEDGNRIG